VQTTKQQWGYGLPDQAHAQRPDAAPPPRGSKSPWLRHLRGDLTGGFSAAILNIPVSMGYGMLALAPLGPEYIGVGVLAGLYACVCGGFTSLLLGANTTMSYAPRSLITFLIGSLVLQTLVLSAHEALGRLDSASLLALVFALIFLAGLMQVIFGLMRLGDFVKYLPAPVLAGFQNAAAVLIFVSQINVMLGLKPGVPLADIGRAVASIQPLTLLIGVVTCAVTLNGAKLSKKIPPSILGFLVGIGAYYLLVAFGFRAELGPVIGNIPWAIPSPHFLAEFVPLLLDPALRSFLPLLLTAAASLAIVASLDAMLCARLVESDSGLRFNGNRELIRLGAGNMVSAAFGGISNGVNLAASFANHRAGARTSLSLLVSSSLVLAGLLLLPPAIALLPSVVIGAMLVVVSIQLVDRWTLQIAAKLFRRGEDARFGMLVDLAVIIMVATFAIAVNIVLAVLLGFAVTIAVFLFRMSKSVIRREYRCDVVHSRKNREPRLMTTLAQHGHTISVLELEGPIFFGTAENLALRLDDLLQGGASYLLLDLKRVNEVDSTGARIILAAHDRLTKRGKHMLIAGLGARPQVASTLKDMGVTTALGSGKVFDDIDGAIEWSEEHLILSVLGDQEMDGEFPLTHFDVLAGMSADELATMKPLLERRIYAESDVVFREGDEGKELFMIAKGSASVRIRLPGEKRTARLVTFAPGTVFGELALLDQEARSATVEADEELVCYILPHAIFMSLATERPAIAIKLLANLGRELSARLRRANRTIYQLDS
jgi:MFS superfamily sulfate permease-like transporter